MQTRGDDEGTCGGGVVLRLDVEPRAIEEVGEEDVGLDGVKDALRVAGGERDAEGLQCLVEERTRLRLAAVRAL